MHANCSFTHTCALAAAREGASVHANAGFKYGPMCLVGEQQEPESIKHFKAAVVHMEGGAYDVSPDKILNLEH